MFWLLVLLVLSLVGDAPAAVTFEVFAAIKAGSACGDSAATLDLDVLSFPDLETSSCLNQDCCLAIGFVLLVVVVVSMRSPLAPMVKPVP